MNRQGPKISMETRLVAVSAVLSGELSIQDAARRHGVSPMTVQKWHDRFLDAGRAALATDRLGGVATGESAVEQRMRLENEQLKLALDEATVRLRDLAERRGLRRPDPFSDLEALRADSAMPVSRFAALAGIPERSYRFRLVRLRSRGLALGSFPIKGPWPAPQVDAVEAVAAKYAGEWPTWGHRKIAALMRADGPQVSDSTAERAMRRRGLLLPQGFRVDNKTMTGSIA